jgi:hypothetical protein
MSHERMKDVSPAHIKEGANGITRRQFIYGAKSVAVATAVTIATAHPTAAPTLADAATGSATTPEIKLVDDYNNWFFGLFSGDIDIGKIRSGAPRYLTTETVLHEAPTLPWGGTTVGYDGWIRLCQLAAPIMKGLGSLFQASPAHYIQRDNVVFRETIMTIKPTKAVPNALVMPITEKYIIENARIKQIDVFFQDTASFRMRLAALGVYPALAP